MFKLVSKFEPSGDQPEAIKELVEGIKEGKKEQPNNDIENRTIIERIEFLEK